MIYFFCVLYNPQANAYKNMELAKSTGITPIAYLNKVNGSDIKRLKELGVLTLGSNSNVGLGIAFNEFEEHLKLINKKYYIYFDQDTVVKKCAWEKIRETYFDIFENSINNIGIIFYNEVDSIVNRDIVISSGCCFSLNIMEKVGFHDRTFFVEGVDYELCLRLRSKGYKIKSVKINGIDHYSLQDKNEITIFGRDVNIRTYGLARLKDFNISHLRLLKMSTIYKDKKMFLFFTKSLFAFNLKELYNNILKVLF